MTVENFLPEINEELLGNITSTAEVEAWAKALIKAIDKTKKDKVAKALAVILDAVHSVELSAEDLIAHLHKNEALYGAHSFNNGNKKKLYKHPTEQLIWGGVGRRPDWYVKCLLQGMTKESLLVTHKNADRANLEHIKSILAELTSPKTTSKRVAEMNKELSGISKHYLESDETNEVLEKEEPVTKKPTVKSVNKTKIAKATTVKAKATVKATPKTDEAKIPPKTTIRTANKVAKSKATKDATSTTKKTAETA